MSLSKLWQTVDDREVWRARVHGVAESDTTEHALIKYCFFLLHTPANKVLNFLPAPCLLDERLPIFPPSRPLALLTCSERKICLFCTLKKKTTDSLWSQGRTMPHHSFSHWWPLTSVCEEFRDDTRETGRGDHTLLRDVYIYLSGRTGS